jgi:hypothetical protein
MLDVALLAFLRPSSQENDELIAVFTEIDPIAGSEIDAILLDAATHTLHIREIPALKPGQGDGHFSGSFGLEVIKPHAKRLLPSEARYSLTTII